MQLNFWLLLLLLTINSNAVQFNQVPLVGPDDWNLNALPSPNATGHLVFDTISSLLQHWPNTRYHYGHTIVPGTIPTGTLLYHGRNDPEVPTGREWAATDSEFARVFCVEPVECWLLTLVTTRPLRVLYFDGSSANKMPDGPMDTQDLLAWGAVLPERATVEWEYERLNRMCDTLGFDAMQLNFEVMLCNFTDGVQIQTLSKLEEEPRFPHPTYATFHSSVWHDHSPGETRIRLDLPHAISFYDTVLVPSLVSSRYGKARRDHRVLGIDERDVLAVLARVRTIPSHLVLSSNSGIDWRTLFQGIRDRYTIRLDVLQSVLVEDNSVQRAFVLIQTLLGPYRLRSAVVPPPSGSDTAFAAPVFRLCATAHTLFADSESVQATFTESEQLLLTAVRETDKEICRTLVRMWAEGVLALTRDPASALSPDLRLARKWRAEVDRLMDWLGWSVWVQCRPACTAPQESCYLPGVPFSMEEWNSTTPRCVRLFEPYAGLPEWYAGIFAYFFLWDGGGILTAF
ncbi:J domain-containing protein [Mycena venus]|uniref:J domain-containing protein n=1 Tax=Mycena venus TaxID=2733690 RepID=A0A8H6WUR4_9AGAR|nr:J domain-containing protein [Mycena venus]